MGSDKSRMYLENFAKTLMGQLEVRVGDGEVGVDIYEFDNISTSIRRKLYRRVFQDFRHMQASTLTRIVASYKEDNKLEPTDQSHGPSYEALHSGASRCTLQHVHKRKDWLDGFADASPLAILQHEAATIIVATMYDIAVQEMAKQPVAS